MHASLSSLALLAALTSFWLNGQTGAPPREAVAGFPNPPASAAPPHVPIFSGYVVQFTATSITVSRKLPSSKDSIRRSFLIDPQTKIEGKLHANARVTVRFEAKPEGDRAVRIIVRG